MVIKVLTEIKRQVYEHSENLNQEIEIFESTNGNYTAQKCNWTGKYTRGVQQQTGWRIRWINELEDKAVEFTQTEQQKKKF